MSAATQTLQTKERPILFSGAMVRKILAGEKSQTRRVITPQPEHKQVHQYRGETIYDDEHRMFCWKDLVLENIWDFPNNEDRRALAGRCPYDAPGNHLWVRESWGRFDADHIINQKRFYYAADTLPGTDGDRIRLDYGYKYKPSIHMPKEASRITLEITSVRVERLQEISENDAVAEGVGEAVSDASGVIGYGNDSTRYPVNFRNGFHLLWDEINEDRGFGWDSNPFVWVVAFVRV